MIVIDDILFSDDVKNISFVCNLQKCKGACCIEGDSGAPLEADEVDLVKKFYPRFKKYMSEKGIAAVEKYGYSVIEEEDEYTGIATPLMDGTGACAYVNFDKSGISYCAIEKAYLDGKTDWRKPISCHLYPIRIKAYEGFTAVNYDEWDICSDACKLGEKLKVSVYQFLKEPLIRKFGAEVYDALAASIKYAGEDS